MNEIKETQKNELIYKVHLLNENRPIELAKEFTK
jgi:hypothetical protein